MYENLECISKISLSLQHFIDKQTSTQKEKYKKSSEYICSVFSLFIYLYYVQSFVIHLTLGETRQFYTQAIFFFFFFFFQLPCLFPILGNRQRLLQDGLSSAFSTVQRNYCNSLSARSFHFHFLFLSSIWLKTRRIGRRHHGIHITRWRTDSEIINWN